MQNDFSADLPQASIPANEPALIPSMLWSLQRALSPPISWRYLLYSSAPCFSTANRETLLLISISALLNSGTRVSRIRPMLCWDLRPGTWDEKQSRPEQLRSLLLLKEGMREAMKGTAAQIALPRAAAEESETEAKQIQEPRVWRRGWFSLQLWGFKSHHESPDKASSTTSVPREVPLLPS